MAAEIQISNLFKKYPNGTEALKGVDLDIAKGAFFALLGPNGAGKSTLVKIVTTLIRKDSGEFLLGGFNPETQASFIQNYLGVASQDNELDPGETAENLLVFQGRLFGLSRAQARQRADELITRFDLTTERKKKAGSLSGGNKRRLHCALALVHKPGLLFLDEPTVGMDPLARSNFWEVITQMNKQEDVTVFLTTQYLEEADKHASDMALIIDGKIHYSGTVSDFKEKVNPLQEMSLEESYLKFVRTISKEINN